METYNGWKNRETWNVSLWIMNDETLYLNAEAYVRAFGSVSWDDFVEWACLDGASTPDGYAFDDPALDREALTEVLEDFAR